MTGQHKVSDEEFDRLVALQEQVLGELKAKGSEFSASDRLTRDELYDERFDRPARDSESGSAGDVPAQSD